MESTSSESQSAAEELEGFGRSFLRAMSSPLSPEEKLQYRTGSTGYWVALLLPLALYIGDLDNDKATITAVAIISLNAVLLCVLQLFELNLNYILLRMRRLNIALSGTILAIGFFHEGDLYKVAAYLALHFTFPYVFYNMIKQHPRSFTFGEGVLVNSAITFKFWIASQSLPFPEHTVSMKDIREPEMISLFLDLTFFAVILGCRLILLMQKPWKMFVLEEMLSLWAKYCIIAFFYRISVPNDEVVMYLMTWPFQFLFANETRLTLMSIWFTVSVITGVGFLFKALYGTQTTTVDRKMFHFAIVAVFLPGVALDHSLIYCCSAVLFFLFVLIETTRLLRLDILGFKIGHLIHSKVNHFRDHQDEGGLLVTPVYLLTGVALPIWLTGVDDGNNLSPVQYAACLSGIMSIGIGDTFASIGGSYFGRTRWKSTSKTVEGTICSIFAQMFFIFLIFLADVLPYNSVSFVALLIAIFINGIVEGNTNQIDNLVLPLITFIVIHGVSYFVTHIIPQTLLENLFS